MRAEVAAPVCPAEGSLTASMTLFPGPHPDPGNKRGLDSASRAKPVTITRRHRQHGRRYRARDSCPIGSLFAPWHAGAALGIHSRTDQGGPLIGLPRSNCKLSSTGKRRIPLSAASPTGRRLGQVPDIPICSRIRNGTLSVHAAAWTDSCRATRPICWSSATTSFAGRPPDPFSSRNIPGKRLRLEKARRLAGSILRQRLVRSRWRVPAQGGGLTQTSCSAGFARSRHGRPRPTPARGGRSPRRVRPAASAPPRACSADDCHHRPERCGSGAIESRGQGWGLL